MSFTMYLVLQTQLLNNLYIIHLVLQITIPQLTLII